MYVEMSVIILITCVKLQAQPFVAPTFIANKVYSYKVIVVIVFCNLSRITLICSMTSGVRISNKKVYLFKIFTKKATDTHRIED